MAEDHATAAITIAQQILRGDVEPYQGAAAIWRQMAEDDAEYPAELRVFVGLASEWQDHPEHREALDNDIRDEARQLADRHRLQNHPP